MRSYLITAAAAVLVVLGTGCSTTTPSAPSAPTPTLAEAQAMTQGQLCDALTAFFTDELHVVDLQAQPLRPPDTIVSPSAVCSVAQGDKQVGRWECLRTATRLDPTEGVPRYTEMSGVEHPVSVRDNRADGSDIRFATRIDEWNARLFIYPADIRTANGLLDIDDRNMHKAAEFLIELTRQLASMPE